LDTAPLDVLGTVANIFVIIAPVGGLIYFLINRKLEQKRRPLIQTVKLFKEMPSEKEDEERKDWMFGWRLINSGGTTAFGVGVVIDFWSSNHPEIGTQRFKLFENMDILPEKVRNDPPPEIIMFYYSKEKVIGLSQRMQGMSTDSLKVERKLKFESFDASFGVGYVVSITFSGSNLTDEDRMARRFSVGIRPDGMPDITDLKGWKMP